MRRVVLVGLAVLALGACGDDDGGGGSASGSTAGEATTTTAAAAVPEPVALGEATQPVVVGHRGASADFPENTVEAFTGAAEVGADWVELDVRLSSDGVAMLSHDPETAAGSVVTATSSADLGEEGIDTFADGLAAIEEAGVGVDVEVKGLPTEPDYDESLAVADETVAVLEDAGLTVPFVVSSFNPSILDRVRELTDDEMTTVRIFPAGGDAATLAPQVAADGDDGVALEFDAETVDAIPVYLDAGLPVWVWTVDVPDSAEAVIAAGAEAVITNDPALISEALGV